MLRFSNFEATYRIVILYFAKEPIYIIFKLIMDTYGPEEKN